MVSQATESWDKASEAKKTEVTAALKKIFDDNKDLASKIKIEYTFENVYDLKQGQNMSNGGLSISGNLSKDKKDQLETIKEQFTAATSGIQTKINISVSYGIGDVVDPIEDCSVVLDSQKEAGADTVTFAPKPGVVYLLDFWATWCPPCQGPMAENQEMLEKNTDWEGKAEIVGMSIDNDTSTVTNHCNAKGWTKPRMLHVRNGKCQADKLFSFRGIPFCVLLDKESKIVFMGHPASRNMAEDINKLINGEKITGEGTTAADDEEEESGAGVDQTQVTKASEEFPKLVDEALASGKISAEVKSKMMRGFFVLVTQGKFNNSTGAFTYTLQHFQVVLGSQEAADAVLGAGATLKASELWKTNVRQQVV